MISSKKTQKNLNISSKKIKSIKNHLLKEWHPTKNGHLTPSDVTYSSTKKIWWICENGHEWQTSMCNRHNGNNCPYCSNRKLLKRYNDLQTKNPNLTKEWHPTKNGDLTPSDVFPNSNKKVWWQCDKGHEWQASISHRNNGTNCPICSNQKILKDYNDLQTLNPTLAKQWHFTKNGTLTPSDVFPNSNKKVWWKCEKGHEWQATISHRNNGTQCPYCSGKKILKGYNNLQTLNPILAKQWHFTKNGALTPSDVTQNSNKKVWWQCDKGHEWQATINNRNKGRNCPICSSERKTSFPEQAIYYYLSQIFKSTSNRKLINKKEADIFIEEFNLIIEYDGVYFHRNSKKRDINKNKTFQDYHFIRIRENGLMPIEDYGCINYILKNTSITQLEEMIYFIFDYIQEHFSLSKSSLNKIDTLNIDLNKDQFQIYKSFIFKEKESSLESTYPTLAKQWHTTKNVHLKPSDVTPNSNKKVWWQCDKGHEWQAVIASRSRNKNSSNCPICSNKKILKGYNDLQTINPNLAKEWHSTKNGDLTPSDVPYGSRKKVWWQCDKGHEWQRVIYERNKGSGCPYCKTIKHN